MTQNQIRRLRQRGLFDYTSQFSFKCRMNHNDAYKAILDYLGLGKPNDTCHLKGFLIQKETNETTQIGTELNGTWFVSFTPVKGVVTDLIEGYKCELSIVNKENTIDRIYRYSLIALNPEETYFEQELVQNYSFSPFLIFNIQIYQVIFFRILRGIMPYDTYTDFKEKLPDTFIDSLAREALPDEIKKNIISKRRFGLRR